MARRSKMPFVVGPGLAFVACSVGMAVTHDVLPFLVLAGMGALFETLARPAIVAVIREKYPAAHRGAVTGRIRTWCSLVFLISGIASAWSLDRTSATPLPMIRSQMLLAAALSVAGFLVFRTIRLDDVRTSGDRDHRSRFAKPYTSRGQTADLHATFLSAVCTPWVECCSRPFFPCCLAIG
jgi:MFS family permease